MPLFHMKDTRSCKNSAVICPSKYTGCNASFYSRQPYSKGDRIGVQQCVMRSKFLVWNEVRKTCYFSAVSQGGNLTKLKSVLVASLNNYYDGTVLKRFFFYHKALKLTFMPKRGLHLCQYYQSSANHWFRKSRACPSKSCRQFFYLPQTETKLCRIR